MRRNFRVDEDRLSPFRKEDDDDDDGREPSMDLRRGLSLDEERLELEWLSRSSPRRD